MSQQLFRVRAIQPGSAVIEESEHQSVSQDALYKSLQSKGLMVLELVPINRTQKKIGEAGSFQRGHTRSIDLAWWCREMTTLLRAGMTVVEAVDTMQVQTTKGAQAILQTRLLKALQEGKSLSVAMESSGFFPRVLIASVIASERTGRLIDALTDYIQYQEQLKNLQKKSVSAAIYPFMVMGIGLIIVLFLLMYVLPRFATLYDSLQGDISPMTQIVLGISKFLARHWSVFAGLIVVGVCCVVIAWQSGGLKRFFIWIVQWLPLTRNAVADFNRAKLYQALGLTLKGGYPLSEAIAVCETLGLSADLSGRITQSKWAIEQGHAASKALGDAGIADEVALRLLRVGERGGQFVLVLQTLAERHADRFSIFIQRLTTFIEPILLLLVAMIVGGIVVMMYMPIFDIASGLH